MILLYNHQGNIASMVITENSTSLLHWAVTNKVTCIVAFFFSIYHKSSSGMICKWIINIKYSSMCLVDFSVSWQVIAGCIFLHYLMH